MAAVIGVSDSQLRRLFAEEVGRPPHRLLADIRFKVAAQLLADPAMRVKEIMERVGVSDPSHFCREFRARFGVSPSEYRVRNAVARGSANKFTVAPIDHR